MCYIKNNRSCRLLLRNDFRKELIKERQHNNKASATLNKPVTLLKV